MIRQVLSRGDGRRAPARRILNLGIITALATALVVTGAGVTFALWTSSAAVTSQATTAKLTLSANNFDTVAAVFKNHALTATGSVTVTNQTVSASTIAGQLTMALDAVAGGSAQLAGAISVRVWGPVSSAGLCTPSATPSGSTNVTGTWSAMPVVSSTLTAGESKSWCIRSQAAQRDDLASTAGTLALQPRVTATLTVGSWTATAVKQATQSTEYIYPTWSPNPLSWYQLRNVASSSCVDVETAADVNGTFVIDYGCKTGNAADSYNQQWRFSAGTGNYYQLTPRMTSTLQLDTQSTASGASAQINTASGTDRQQWQLQAASSTEYQLVNRLTGLCLGRAGTTPTGNTVYAASECSGSSAQRFTLVVKETQTAALDSISCAPETSGGNSRIRYSWAVGSPAVGDYLFQVNLGGGTWTTVATAPSGSTSVLIDPPALNALWAAADASYNVRIRAAGDTVTLAATSTLWKGSSPNRILCSQPVANVDGLSCTSVAGGVSYAWTSPAFGQYDFQAQQGSTWYTIGTAASGSTSATFASAPPTQLVNGTKAFRVQAGGVTLSSTITSVWVGAINGGANVLQCAQPTVPLPWLSCANTGTAPANYSVTLGWSQPSTAAYTIEARRNGGEWSTIGTTGIGVLTHTITIPPTNNNGYDIRIVSGGSTLIESTLTADTRSGSRYWRCSTSTLEVASCTGNNLEYIAYSWTAATPDAANTTFRLSVDGTVVKSSSNGYWKTIQLYTSDPQPVTVATFGVGVRSVLIEQKVGSGAWTAIAAGYITIQAGSGTAGTNLKCA